MFYYRNLLKDIVSCSISEIEHDKFVPIELTAAQKEFFHENPKNITISEVLNMKTNAEIINEENRRKRENLNIAEYRQTKLVMLENLSVATSDRFIKIHHERNSVISSVLHSLDYNDTIYSEEKIRQICIDIDTFAKKCRTEYYRIENLINQANTADDIDAAFDSNHYAQFTVEEKS